MGNVKDDKVDVGDGWCDGNNDIQKKSFVIGCRDGGNMSDRISLGNEVKG